MHCRNSKPIFLQAWVKDYADRKKEVFAIFKDLEKNICRDMILKKGRRIDNRAFDEVRPITCEVGLLAAVFMAVLFSPPAGKTQVLGVLTLGSGPDEQRIETLSGERTQILYAPL